MPQNSKFHGLAISILTKSRFQGGHNPQKVLIKLRVTHRDPPSEDLSKVIYQKGDDKLLPKEKVYRSRIRYSVKILSIVIFSEDFSKRISYSIYSAPLRHLKIVKWFLTFWGGGRLDIVTAFRYDRGTSKSLSPEDTI